MATTVLSNSVYYSVSSGPHSSARNIVLHKRPDHTGFGIYIGEDVPSGLYIATVERNSPAANANIQPGDRVLAVNGQSVSSMVKNPKETLIKAANNSQTLTLTIQSTDIFETLNIPLINSYENNENHLKQQISSQRTFDKNTNLESYIKSILGNENVQLLPVPNSLNDNQFILQSGSYPMSSMNFNSYPTDPFRSKDHKQGYRHHHHHRHHHRRHPKRKIVDSKETQTAMDDSQDEYISQEQTSTSLSRQYPSKPIMGTSHRMLRTQQLSSNDNPTDESNDSKTLSTTTNTFLGTAAQQSPKLGQVTRFPPTQRMADVVTAAVVASRNNPELAKNAEEISTRQPGDVPTRTTTLPPSQQSDLVSKRANVEVMQDQNPPLPPYTAVADTYTSSKPVDNRGNINGVSDNIRSAPENRQPAMTPKVDMNMIPSSIRGEGVRVIHLRRSPDYEGFGFHLQYNKNYFLVHKIENDSPAASSGLKLDDIVLSVNQQSTENMPHPTFVSIVSGSSNVDFIVQPREAYLRSKDQPKQNIQPLPPIPRNNNNEDNNSLKTGLSKALSKIKSR
ncbi:unnamed protein product [Rotaria sp. Silwood2]|nr:unnamed protein product [Rotaria sp. Silwood2]CAF4092571.1 unnamed protein product [Rotaria sp. Silwood2]